MNAHMGLALIRFANAQVDGDVMITDLEPIATDIDDQITDIENFIEDEVLPDISKLEFIDLFFGETFESDYYDFADSLESLMETLVNKLDLLGPPIETFLDSLDDGFSNPNFEYHIRTVKTGSADFTFYLEIESQDILIFNRAFFENQKALDQHNFDMNSSIDDGFDCLDQYYDGTDDDNIFNTCVNNFREGIDYGLEWCNTLETIITNEPIVAFDIETDFIEELRSIFNEIDARLNGAEYDIGPSSEGKKIKPLNILRALHGGFATEINGFYTASSPNTYDFGGIFPLGLNQHVIDQISADAVIYEDYNDDSSFMDRWIAMEASWENDIVNSPDDPDPHVGIAFSKSLQLFDSTIEKLSEAFDSLDEEQVGQFYDSWRDIDISDDIDEIKDHLVSFSDAGDAMFIVLVIEDDYNTGASHDIQNSTDFYAMPFHSINAEMILDISNGMIKGVQAISDLSNELYSNMDDVIDLDLNPSYLDFSDIENDLDLIEIFKQSNPNWLSLTNEGIEWFHNTGEDLEDAFDEIYSFCIELDDYAQENDLDLLINEDELNSIKDFSLELYNDFSDPTTSTLIDDENINFSAWFYYPPNFLTLWENASLGEDSPDNSMHCLFPDRSTNLDCDAECYGDTVDECGICNGDGSSCAVYIKSSVTTTVDDAELSEMDTFKENFSAFIETALALPEGTVEVINVSILARGAAAIEVEFTITLTEEELALTDFESIADITNALEEIKNVIKDGLPPFIYGCTDSGADNYDENTTIDDGSCTFLAIYPSEIPEDYSLLTYPNPFNPITNITYVLPENVNVNIIIYDLSGKQVQSLINGFQSVGYHSVVWNANNYSSGMYLVKMYANGSTFGKYVSTQKILLIK